MKRDELLQLLTKLAAQDLADSATIYDHPCSVAIREIERLDTEANKWAEAYRQAKETAQEQQATQAAAIEALEVERDRYREALGRIAKGVEEYDHLDDAAADAGVAIQEDLR